MKWVESQRLEAQLRSIAESAGFELVASQPKDQCYKRVVKLKSGFNLSAFAVIEKKSDWSGNFIMLEICVYLGNRQDSSMFLCSERTEIRSGDTVSPAMFAGLLSDVCKSAADALGEAAQATGVAAMTGGF